MEKKTKKLVSAKTLALLGIMGALVACASGCATVQHEAGQLGYHTKRYGLSGGMQRLSTLPARIGFDLTK